MFELHTNFVFILENIFLIIAMAESLIEEKASATPTEDVESPKKEEDDVKMFSSSEVKKVTVATPSADIVVVKCECCKLTEECTIAYIARVRERYQGSWICGLCAEAVKDEIDKSGWRINKDEALEHQASFRVKFRSV